MAERKLWEGNGPGGLCGNSDEEALQGEPGAAVHHSDAGDSGIRGWYIQCGIVNPGSDRGQYRSGEHVTGTRCAQLHFLLDSHCGNSVRLPGLF